MVLFLGHLRLRGRTTNTVFQQRVANLKGALDESPCSLEHLQYAVAKLAKFLDRTSNFTKLLDATDVTDEKLTRLVLDELPNVLDELQRALLLQQDLAIVEKLHQAQTKLLELFLKFHDRASTSQDQGLRAYAENYKLLAKVHQAHNQARLAAADKLAIVNPARKVAADIAATAYAIFKTSATDKLKLQQHLHQQLAEIASYQQEQVKLEVGKFLKLYELADQYERALRLSSAQAQDKARVELKQKYDDFFVALPEAEKEFFGYQLEKILVAKQPRFIQVAPSASETTKSSTEVLFERLRQFAAKAPVEVLERRIQQFMDDFNKIQTADYPYGQRYQKSDPAHEQSFLQALQRQLKSQIPSEPALRAEFLSAVYPKIRLMYPALLKHEWLAASDPVNFLGELANDSQRQAGHKAWQDKDFKLAGELVAAFAKLSQPQSAEESVAAREQLNKLIARAKWVEIASDQQQAPRQLERFGEYFYFHVVDKLGQDSQAAPLLKILQKQLRFTVSTDDEETKTLMSDIDDSSDKLQGSVNEVLAKLANRVLELQVEDKFTKQIKKLFERNDRGIFNNQLRKVNLPKATVMRQVQRCGKDLKQIAGLLQQAKEACQEEKDPEIKAAKLRNLDRLDEAYKSLASRFESANGRIQKSRAKTRSAATTPATSPAPGVSAEKIDEVFTQITRLVDELTAKLNTVELTQEIITSLKMEYKDKIKKLDFTDFTTANFKYLLSLSLESKRLTHYNQYYSIDASVVESALVQRIDDCVAVKLAELAPTKAAVPARTKPVVAMSPKTETVLTIPAPVPVKLSEWQQMVQEFSAQAASTATEVFTNMVLAVATQVPEIKVPVITATSSEVEALLRQCEQQYDLLKEVHRAILHVPGADFAAKVADKRLISQLMVVNNALDQLVAAVQPMVDAAQLEAIRAGELIKSIRQLQKDQLWHYLFSHADQVLERDQQLPSEALVAALKKANTQLSGEWEYSSLIRAADGRKPALGYEDYSSYARHAAILLVKLAGAEQQGYPREVMFGMPQDLEQLYAEVVSASPKRQQVVEDQVRAWRQAQPLADAIVALLHTQDLSQLPAMLAEYHEVAATIDLHTDENSIFYYAFAKKIELEIARAGLDSSVIGSSLGNSREETVSHISQQVTAYVQQVQWMAMLDWDSRQEALARTVQELLSRNEGDLIQQVEKQWQLQQAQQALASLAQELAVIKAVMANSSIEFEQREEKLATLSTTVNTALAAMPADLLAQGRAAMQQQLLFVITELSQQSDAVALKSIDCATELATIMEALERCPPLADGLAGWWLDQLGAATPVIKERLPSIAQGTDPAPCGQQLLAIAQQFQHWQLARVAMLQIVQLYEDFIQDADTPEEISVVRAQAVTEKVKALLALVPEAEALVKSYFGSGLQAIAADESVSVVLARRMEDANVAKLKDTCLIALHGIKNATSVADIENLSIHTLLHELSSLSPIAWSVLQLAMTKELELDSELSVTEFAREFSSFLAVYGAEKQQLLQSQTAAMTTEYVLDPLRSPALHEDVKELISRYEACYRDNRVEDAERMARGLLFHAYAIADMRQRQAFVNELTSELRHIYPNFKLPAVTGLTAVECLSRAMVDHMHAVQPQLASSENLKLNSREDVKVPLLQIRKTAEQAYAERIDNLDNCIKNKNFYSGDFTAKVDKLVSLLDIQSGVAYKAAAGDQDAKVYAPLVSKVLRDLPKLLVQIRNYLDTSQFKPNSKLKVGLEANYQQLFAVFARYQAYAATHTNEELKQLASSEVVLSVLASANLTANQQHLAVKAQPISKTSHSAQDVVRDLEQRIAFMQQDFIRLCGNPLVKGNFFYGKTLLQAATLVELQAMAGKAAELKTLLLSVDPAQATVTIDTLAQEIQLKIAELEPVVNNALRQRQETASKAPDITAAAYVTNFLMKVVQDVIEQLESSNLKQLEFFNISDRFEGVINLLQAYKGLVPAFYQALPNVVKMLPEDMQKNLAGNPVMPTQASPEACSQYLQQLLEGIKAARRLQLAQEKLIHVESDVRSLAARHQQRHDQLSSPTAEKLSSQQWLDAFKQAQKDEDNYTELLEIIPHPLDPEQLNKASELTSGLAAVEQQVPALARQAVLAMLTEITAQLEGKPASEAQLASWTGALPQLWHFGKDAALVQAINQVFSDIKGCKALTIESSYTDIHDNLRVLQTQPKKAQAADKQAAIIAFKQALRAEVDKLTATGAMLDTLEVNEMLMAALVSNNVTVTEDVLVALRTNILRELKVDLSEDESPVYVAELFQQKVRENATNTLQVPLPQPPKQDSPSLAEDPEDLSWLYDLEDAVLVDVSAENIIKVLLATQPLAKADEVLLSTLDRVDMETIVHEYETRLDSLNANQAVSDEYQSLLAQMQQLGESMQKKSAHVYEYWLAGANNLQSRIEAQLRVVQRNEQVIKHVDHIVEQYLESDPQQLDLAVKNIRDFYLGDGSADYRANAYLQQGIAQELADRLEEEGHSFEIDRSDLAAVLQEAEEFFLAQRLQPVLAELEQYGVDMHAMQSGIAEQLQALLDSLPASRRERVKGEFLQKYLPSLRLTPEQVAGLDNLQFSKIIEQQVKLIHASQQAAIVAVANLPQRLANIEDAIADLFSIPENTSIAEQIELLYLLQEDQQRYEQQQLALRACVRDITQLKKTQPQLASVGDGVYQALFDRALSIQQQLTQKLTTVKEKIAELELKAEAMQHAEQIFFGYQAATSGRGRGELAAVATTTPNYIVEHRDAWHARPELQQAIVQEIAQRLEQAGHSVAVDCDDLPVMLHEVEKFFVLQATAQQQAPSRLVISLVAEIEQAAGDLTALETIDIEQRLATLPALLAVSTDARAELVNWANGKGFKLQPNADVASLVNQVQQQLQDFASKAAQPRREQIVAGVKKFAERYAQLVAERVAETADFDELDTMYPARYENFIRGQFEEDYQGIERAVFVTSLLAELDIAGEVDMDVESLLEQVREKFAAQVNAAYAARQEAIAEIKGLPRRLYELVDATTDDDNIEALWQKQQELAAITAALEQAQDEYPQALPVAVSYDELLDQAQVLAQALTERMDTLQAVVVDKLAELNARQAQVVETLYREQHYTIAAMTNLSERREALIILQQPMVNQLLAIDRLIHQIKLEFAKANELGIDSSSLMRQLEWAQQTREKLVTLQQDNSKQLNMLSNSKLKTEFAHTEPLLLVNGLMRDIEQGSIEQLRDLLSGEIEARLTPLPKLLNVSRRVCKGFVADINSKYPLLKLPAMRGLFMHKPIQQYREAITKYARIRAVELLCEREQQIRQQAAELCAKYHVVGVDPDQLWTEFEEIHLQLDARERELFIETMRETLSLSPATTIHTVGSAAELQELQQQLAAHHHTQAMATKVSPTTPTVLLDPAKWAVFYSGNAGLKTADAKINFIATSINDTLTAYDKYPGASIAMNFKPLPGGRYLAQAAINITDPTMQTQDKMRIMLETMESVICTKPQTVVIDGTNPYMVEAGRQMAQWVQKYVQDHAAEYDNYTFKIECDDSQCTISEEVKRTVSDYMKTVEQEMLDVEGLKNPQHFLNLLRAKCVPQPAAALESATVPEASVSGLPLSTIASPSPSSVIGKNMTGW